MKTTDYLYSATFSCSFASTPTLLSPSPIERAIEHRHSVTTARDSRIPYPLATCTWLHRECRATWATQATVAEAVPTRAERTFRELRGLSAVRLLQEVMIAFFSLGDLVVIIAF